MERDQHQRPTLDYKCIKCGQSIVDDTERVGVAFEIELGELVETRTRPARRQQPGRGHSFISAAYRTRM